jgi:cytoskeletal protein CcmA (bactofilin family)
MDQNTGQIVEGASLEEETPDTGGAATQPTTATDAQKSADKGPIDASGGTKKDEPPSTSGKQKGPNKLKALLQRVNIYFLLFLLILIIALMVVFIGMQTAKKQSGNNEITSQTLSPETINQLKGNDVKIGDAKQTLNIESNAVFAGRVLVQGGTDIAGAVKIGGTTSLNSVTVTGTSNFDQTQVNTLAVSGTASIQGALTVQNTLNVSSGGSFGGPLTAPQATINTLTLNQDLQLNRHIDAGGATPSKSNGTALGAGGTASNSGTDTAGTVVINTGGGPPAGCFVTINFVQRFSGTPHIALTPASSDAASLNYYVNRNTGSFSICATNPTAGRSYQFDYLVID